MTDKLIIAFNISKTYDLLIQGKGNRDSVYDCTRHYWANVKIEKAELADFAFGVAHGKVVGLLRLKWKPPRQSSLFSSNKPVPHLYSVFTALGTAMHQKFSHTCTQPLGLQELRCIGNSATRHLFSCHLI